MEYKNKITMDGQSLDIKQTHLEKLKELFPEVITEGKVDWEKLKATLGEEINFSNERYVLNWAGKSDAFRVLQEPTTATLAPDKEESVNFDTTNHIFIEGENLEVLKVLQKSYYGKVKMIYIDPPYNTGNDHFIYPDRFSESKEEYLKRVGDKDEDGYLTREGLFRKNSRDSGYYHSNWMNMIYPRLFLAKNLLRDDGIVFISIDDNEVHNLKMIMNEIFGEENFIEQIIWKKRYGGGAKEKYLVNLHEYIIMYSKNKDVLMPIFIPNNKQFIDKYYTKKDEKYKDRGPYRTQPLEAAKSMGERKNLVYDIPGPNGLSISPKRQWLWSKERTLKALDNNELDFNQDKEGNWTVNIKQYLRDEDGNEKPLKVTSIIEDIYTQHGTREIENIFGNVDYFPYPKPTAIIKHLSQFGSEKDDIILDFFSGSATSAHAVLDQNSENGGNRKFICVQLPEETEKDSEAYKAGFKTITDIAKERIRRVIQKIEKERKENKNLFSENDNKALDLGFKVFKLQSSNFKVWRGDKFENDEQLAKQLQAFTDPTKEGSTEENMLYELLLKSGCDLNSKIDSNGSYFVVNDSEMVVALTKMNDVIVKEIINLKPEKCITLDKLFAGNDQLKTNTVLQMKDAGIEFKTI